jgi:hypothetical protein
VHWRPTYYDDREVGDGTALERAGLLGWELELYSNPAKPVSFNFQTQTQWLYDGFSFSGTGGLLFRALPQLDLEVLPAAIYTFGEPRFAELGPVAGQYVFGKLDAKSIGTTLRATYTFAPRLTLQAHAQRRPTPTSRRACSTRTSSCAGSTLSARRSSSSTRTRRCRRCC